MKLFYSPGACSLGIHILLQEIGNPFEAEKVDLKSQQQYSDAFKGVNPKSKVPTLMRDDGSVLTEFPAIATWLARKNPNRNLMPSDADAEARVIEAMEHVVSTIHMQGFTRIFRPGNFSPNEADHDAVKARGKEIVEKGLGLMNQALEGKDYIAGQFSVADAALFYVELWAADRMNMQLPPNCAAHLARMKSRPAVQKVLQAEGLAA